MKKEHSGENFCKEPAAPPPFDIVYQEYKQAVYSYAFYLTRDRHDADDLFQESWLRIVKKMPEKLKMDSLKAWIFTVITNIYRDDLRKKKIRRLFLIQKINESCAGESTHPHIQGSHQAAEREMSNLNQKIFSAVNLLPEKQRMVFILKEISGFRQTDIGDILNMPLGTVKSLMHRAVKGLQRELAPFRQESIKTRGQNAV